MTRKPIKGNSLAEVNPELALEWHPTKNGNLTPFEVSLGTHKKVWWKCDMGNDHEWESSVKNRSRLKGCPVCIGRKVVLSNCLATLKPELAKEWHPTKNGDLTPNDITVSSGKKVWWKCDMGNDHEWLSIVSDRSRGNRCPICLGQKVVLSNCLATLKPELAKEWHPTKNGKLTPYNVVPGSNKKVWWKCNKGNDHEWNTTVSNRSKGVGCPVCRSLKVVLSNCLATLKPKLAKEWHLTKNGDLTPNNVTPGSNKKVWWKCNKGDDHEWCSRIVHRSKGVGCPVCLGQKIVLSNCLATIKPELAKEWHPTKNGDLTPFDVVLGTNKKVWWKCNKGDDHEWKCSVGHRSSGTGCPYCTLTPQSKQELSITFELIKFFQINPKGFKTRVKGKLWTIDIYIRELKLGIEFDGSYWHKDKRDLDKLKTEKLEFEGFKIMRVREEPLKAITDIDVISTKPFNAKEVTNNILIHILEFYSLDTKRIQRIEEYLLKDDIQNEKRLDAYIEMILTEKADKKNQI
ncbi:zinc-ribbon domain-containing protein [Gaetbulibacter aquiaggeris]|uniref:Zinc-ribbon domain-containing protein n=1 Tax=Gaetbulibacter aquiaggeris TaxID=1735373 RepID=A0ABW7MWH2_9FLAO